MRKKKHWPELGPSNWGDLERAAVSVMESLSMKKIAVETAAAILALRRLVEAVCAAREDELLATLTGGGLRIALDEGTATLTIGVVQEPGKPAQWVETISVNPLDEDFGLLESTRFAASTVGTH